MPSRKEAVLSVDSSFSVLMHEFEKYASYSPQDLNDNAPWFYPMLTRLSDQAVMLSCRHAGAIGFRPHSQICIESGTKVRAWILLERWLSHEQPGIFPHPELIAGLPPSTTDILRPYIKNAYELCRYLAELVGEPVPRRDKDLIASIHQLPDPQMLVVLYALFETRRGFEPPNKLLQVGPNRTYDGIVEVLDLIKYNLKLPIDPPSRSSLRKLIPPLRDDYKLIIYPENSKKGVRLAPDVEACLEKHPDLLPIPPFESAKPFYRVHRPEAYTTGV